MDALDRKVGQVDRYIGGLEKLMGARIDEIVLLLPYRLPIAVTESTTPSFSWYHAPWPP